jgi:hypothetical protein
MGAVVEDSAVPVSPGEGLTVIVGAPGSAATTSGGSGRQERVADDLGERVDCAFSDNPVRKRRATPAGTTRADGAERSERQGRARYLQTTKVHGKTRKKCTGKLVSGTVKFTVATTRATLSRGYTVSATGTAVRSHGAQRLSLSLRRRLTAGRYTLTLTDGSGHRLTTVVIVAGG